MSSQEDGGNRQQIILLYCGQSPNKSVMESHQRLPVEWGDGQIMGIGRDKEKVKQSSM